MFTIILQSTTARVCGQCHQLNRYYQAFESPPPTPHPVYPFLLYLYNFLVCTPPRPPYRYPIYIPSLLFFTKY